MEIIKDAEVKIRLSKNLKDEFTSITKQKAINPSEWLRQQIERFVREHQQDSQ